MPRRRANPIFARFYAKVSPTMDRGGIAERRAELLSGLTGMVIEIGCGNGLNFPHYPATVERVLAIEPEPYLRNLAEHAVAQAPVPIDVSDGSAEHLPAGDGAYDAAVFSLVLCSVPDQHAALREAHRVLKPGGQLRFLEHVRAPSPGYARVQRALDATIWPRVFGGCHTGRDTETAIGAAGFAIAQIEHFNFPPGRTLDPATAHIRGAATRDA